MPGVWNLTPNWFHRPRTSSSILQQLYGAVYLRTHFLVCFLSLRIIFTFQCSNSILSGCSPGTSLPLSTCYCFASRFREPILIQKEELYVTLQRNQLYFLHRINILIKLFDRSVIHFTEDVRISIKRHMDVFMAQPCL